MILATLLNEIAAASHSTVATCIQERGEKPEFDRYLDASNWTFTREKLINEDNTGTSATDSRYRLWVHHPESLVTILTRTFHRLSGDGLPARLSRLSKDKFFAKDEEEEKEQQKPTLKRPTEWRPWELPVAQVGEVEAEEAELLIFLSKKRS